MRWPICGGGTRQVDGVQLEGQPPCRTERPASRQTRVRLLHQDLGSGLCRDGSDALLLPPQHHQGTLWALPAGDGSGNTHAELFTAFLIVGDGFTDHHCSSDISRLRVSACE